MYEGSFTTEPILYVNVFSHVNIMKSIKFENC